MLSRRASRTASCSLRRSMMQIASGVRLLEQLERLLQVDDVDAAPLREDEAAHFGIPASRLVAEVDPGLQELAHRDDGHRDEVPFLVGWLLLPAGLAGTGLRLGPAPPSRWSAGSGYEAAAILAAVCRSSGSG